jgi:hypothetical protein
MLLVIFFNLFAPKKMFFTPKNFITVINIKTLLKKFCVQDMHFYEKKNKTLIFF